MKIDASREPVTAFVALGANLGDARATLISAIEQLNSIEEVVVTKRSSLYATAPVDSSGPDYVNAVVQVRTSLTAPELLRQLHAIEQTAGRVRPYRNAPRTLDLDILLYGDGRVNSDALTIPHPRMAQRAFVLVPLAEIAPACVTAEQLHDVKAQAITKLG